MKSRVFDEFEESLKKAEISMTPLIDMVFILLIFFVVTTTFTKETGITVKKAKAATSEVINEHLFTVALNSDGEYWHESKQYDIQTIVAAIEQAILSDDETHIVIIPDKDGRVEPLIAILDELRAKDITKFSLGTEKKSVEE